MRIDEEYWHLIVRNACGEISQEERNLLNSWVNSDTLNRKQFEQIQDILNNSDLAFGEVNPETDKEWQKLKIQIERMSDSPKLVILWYKYRKVSIAASLLLAMMFASYFIFKPGFETKFVSIKTENFTNSIILPDGSIIFINENSELSYNENFLDNRELKLSGEAYFEVAKDDKHPFTIAAGGTITKVVGTAFNIKAYENENVEISVAEGIVEFGKEDGGKIALTANQSALYNKETSLITQHTKLEIKNELPGSTSEKSTLQEGSETKDKVKWYDKIRNTFTKKPKK